MPYYQFRGNIPKKRHTIFKKPNGSLYYEELMSREGFNSLYSNLYHLNMPTKIKRIGTYTPTLCEAASSPHQARHFKSFALSSSGNFISSRKMLLFNDDLIISKSHPSEQLMDFYRSAHFDELIFVQKGHGLLESQFGELSFSAGDYLVIPRGVIFRLNFINLQADSPRLLVIESTSPITTPKRYRNSFGQLLEHSPFCERDLRTPTLPPPKDSNGDYKITVRLQHAYQEYIYKHHPFDLIGWDGYHFPWAFNIRDFEPIVGSLHQPPPVHQTFEAQGFVVCSFVSRPFDFHPQAVPAPYPHSNVDSDEVIFYSDGEFMSRTGISPESITYHPMGFAHGPQPGKYESSIGKQSTEEQAVMIDTFKPLKLTKEALNIDDQDYPLSWIKDESHGT